MRVLLAVLAIILTLQTAARAEDRDIVAFKRIGIVEGVAIGERLWLRGAGLVRLNLETGRRTDVFDDGVIDIARYGPQLWVLRRIDDQTMALITFDGDGPAVTRATWKRLEDEAFIGLQMTPGTAWVLSPDRLMAFDTSGILFRQQPITGLKPHGVQTGLVMPADRSALYVGFNAGEFGGGLDRIDLKSGRVSRLSAGAHGLCDGLFNPACDPITGLAPDPERPECVLASVGLAHMMVSGKILRVCGRRVSLFAEWPFPDTPPPQPRRYSGKGPPPPPPSFGDLPGQTLPVFGLATSRGELWAVGYRDLIHIADGKTERRQLPEFREMDGIELSQEIAGFLVIRTTMNASFSLSGSTPLLVPRD